MFKDIDVFKCLSVRGPKTRTFGPHTWRELSEADRLLRYPLLIGVTAPRPTTLYRDVVFAIADWGRARETTLCLANSR
jgi:hypothetical protein